MSTIREVAKKAGVSITTVSRILTNDPALHVSEETRIRVMETIKELDYQYTPKKKQIHIGCIMALTYSHSDPYFNDILNGIQAYCSNHNAVISLIVSYEQFLEMKAGLEKQLAELDGLIITDFPNTKRDYITQLNKKLIFVDEHINGYCNVGYNIVDANRMVMEHIIDCGYRKIAYIGGPSDYRDFDFSSRMMVIREVLRQNEIEFDPELVYNCGWDPRICAAQVRELMTKHPDTQAIFAGSDPLATVILAQLNSMGYRCPDDIGIVGFNDAPFACNFSPPLTTLRLPSVEMGEVAARILIEQIQSNTTYKLQILLPVELKVRKSTRKIN